MSKLQKNKKYDNKKSFYLYLFANVTHFYIYSNVEIIMYYPLKNLPEISIPFSDSINDLIFFLLWKLVRFKEQFNDYIIIDIFNHISIWISLHLRLAIFFFDITWAYICKYQWMIIAYNYLVFKHSEFNELYNIIFHFIYKYT